MIHRIYRTQADLTALASAPRVDNGIANTFDYSGVVVKKPWGEERLYSQDREVSVWLLRIDKACGTSLHCHEHKSTALVVISGLVVCVGPEGSFLPARALNPGDAIVFEPGVFHSTWALEDALVVEAESPPLKGDLIRFEDNYGRVGKGYEPAEGQGYESIETGDPYFAALSPLTVALIQLARALVLS